MLWLMLISCLGGPRVGYTGHRYGCSQQCNRPDAECCWPNHTAQMNTRDAETWWSQELGGRPECLVYDMDGDGDVDLRDYSLMLTEDM